ncbi:MAG: hypothetical protein V1777_00310 [Candidatus Micrarchaeota archaeon]
MTNKNSVLLIIGLLLLLAPGILASNGIFLTKNISNFYLETDTALPAVFDVYNSTNQKVCFVPTATISPSDLDLTVAPNDFCLNANETTPVTVTANATSNSDSGNYTLTLHLDYNNTTDQNSVSFHVNQTPDISLNLPDVSLCKNENRNETVSVQNNSGQTQFVRLETSTNGMDITFNQTEFTLDAGQSKDITAHFEVSTSRQSGHYKYLVFSRTDSSTSVQKGEFQVRTCTNQEDTTNFSITTSNVCQLISQGQTKVISFNIQNKNDSTDLFSFTAQSALPINILTSSPVELSDEESQGISIRVSPDYSVPNGRYTVNLTVSNGFLTKNKEACIDVGPESQVSIAPNDLSVIRGNSIGTVLTVQNNSSLTKSVQISTSNATTDVSVSFSQTGFSIGGNRSQNTIVTIQTNSNTALGPQAASLRIRSGEQTYFATVNFTVFAENTPPQPPYNGPVEAKIEIISFPIVIEIANGETKELNFIVQNKSNDRLDNLEIAFTGLPASVRFSPPSRFSLDANQILSMRGQITAANNAVSTSVNVRLLAQNADYKNTQVVRVQVNGINSQTSNQSQNPFGFIITGLFGIGAGNQGWIALILLALIVFMIISENKDHSTWVGIVLLIAILLAILSWNSIYAFWALVVLLVVVFLLAVSWSKRHEVWHLQKKKWHETVRPQTK